MSHRLLVVAFALSLVACGGSIAPDGSGASDAAVDTNASPSPTTTPSPPSPPPDDPPPDGGPTPTPADVYTTPGTECCPIDDHPSCCMHYGGTKAEVGGCGWTCDYLPDPTDPRWERRIDANGCPYWYAPPEIPISCNPRPDTGLPDEGLRDAPTD